MKAMVVLGEKNFILKSYNFDLDHMVSVSILGLLIFHKLRESKNKTSNPGSQDRLREDIPRITHGFAAPSTTPSKSLVFPGKRITSMLSNDEN